MSLSLNRSRHRFLAGAATRAGGLIILLFFVLQVIVDCFHSVSFFPFIHYGMYSSSFSAPDSQNVYVVTVNGNPLRVKDFGPVRWEMIQQPLIAMDRQIRSADNGFDRGKLREGLTRVGLQGLYTRTTPNLVNAPDLPARFPCWYRDYLSRLLGKPVRTLTVDRTRVRYSQGRLVTYKKENWITLG